MAFKYIQSNRLVFLLTEEGTPTGFTIAGENIPKGSLCVDYVSAKLYIFNGTGWEEIGTGQGSISGEVITVYQTPIVPSGTSGFIFPIGTGTNVLDPLNNTMFFYVNTQKSVVNVDWTYESISQDIKWIGQSYNLEQSDMIEIYYDVRLP